MKYLILSLLLIAFFTAKAQSDKVPPLDQSPMDISYYPVDYCILKIQNKTSGPPVMRVLYSRPHKNGRQIFGGLVEYGDVWRLGANQATEIDLFRDVKINNKTVKKGRYTMYAIPYPDKWTIIINRDTDTWGAFKYSDKRDVLRTTVPLLRSDTVTEDMSIYFTQTNSGAAMNILWDNAKVVVPINF